MPMKRSVLKQRLGEKESSKTAAAEAAQSTDDTAEDSDVSSPDRNWKPCPADQLKARVSASGHASADEVIAAARGLRPLTADQAIAAGQARPPLTAMEVFNGLAEEAAAFLFPPPPKPETLFKTLSGSYVPLSALMPADVQALVERGSLSAGEVSEWGRKSTATLTPGRTSRAARVDEWFGSYGSMAGRSGGGGFR